MGPPIGVTPSGWTKVAQPEEVTPIHGQISAQINSIPIKSKFIKSNQTFDVLQIAIRLSNPFHGQIVARKFNLNCAEIIKKDVYFKPFDVHGWLANEVLLIFGDQRVNANSLFVVLCPTEE